jgi:hypothetical protein
VSSPEDSPKLDQGILTSFKSFFLFLSHSSSRIPESVIQGGENGGSLEPQALAAAAMGSLVSPSSLRTSTHLLQICVLPVSNILG